MVREYSEQRQAGADADIEDAPPIRPLRRSTACGRARTPRRTRGRRPAPSAHTRFDARRGRYRSPIPARLIPCTLRSRDAASASGVPRRARRRAVAHCARTDQPPPSTRACAASRIDRTRRPGRARRRPRRRRSSTSQRPSLPREPGRPAARGSSGPTNDLAALAGRRRAAVAEPVHVAQRNARACAAPRAGRRRRGASAARAART